MRARREQGERKGAYRIYTAELFEEVNDDEGLSLPYGPHSLPSPFQFIYDLLLVSHELHDLRKGVRHEILCVSYSFVSTQRREGEEERRRGEEEEEKIRKMERLIPLSCRLRRRWNTSGKLFVTRARVANTSSKSTLLLSPCRLPYSIPLLTFSTSPFLRYTSIKMN